MKYQEIVAHYEACLEKHGDNHLGVDWPRKEDVIKRHRIMLELVREREERISLLDFGCGAAHLYDYILEQGLAKIDYSGLDISEKFIAVCKTKHPNAVFFCGDILANDMVLPSVDYIVMNGVFTEKQSMTHEEMTTYYQEMLKKVFPLAKKGLAFNVMSKQVDWERNDLFHLPLDEAASFIIKYFGRHFVVRNDYGLYEYTVYLYREEFGGN
jgi:SAM-dependent methyltransferase